MDHIELREPDRIRRLSSRRVNEKVDAGLRASAGSQVGPAEARVRLARLDREWDVDRALMALFPVLGGATAVLALRAVLDGRTRNGWLYLFGTQLGFLLVHAVYGWCPPAWALRRLGFRTAREIEAERHALAAKVA